MGDGGEDEFEGSSLGGEGVRGLQARTPPDEIDRILAAAKEAEDVELPWGEPIPKLTERLVRRLRKINERRDAETGEDPR